MTNPPWQDRSPDDADVDAAFAAIVAGWDRTAEPGRRSERGNGRTATGPTDETTDAREQEDLEQEDRDRGAERSAGATNPPPAALPPAPREPPRPAFDVAPDAWRVHIPPDDADQADEGFEQPDPPLPKGDVRYWLALAGLVLGPLVFIVWALSGPHSTTLPLYLSGLATLLGFVALVSRLPDKHDEDDNGARV